MITGGWIFANIGTVGSNEAVNAYILVNGGLPLFIGTFTWDINTAVAIDCNIHPYPVNCGDYIEFMIETPNWRGGIPNNVYLAGGCYIEPLI